MIKYARKFNGELTEIFTLTNNEVEALYDYFLKRAGYVSYEFDPLIILLIRRLDDYIKENKNDSK